MPKPETLAEDGRHLEAARLYCDQASREKNRHKQRRYLNFAARCYESAGEPSLAIKCFLQSGDMNRALDSAVKTHNPKILSNALVTEGHENDVVKFLLQGAIRLIEAREFNDARAFAKESLEFERSVLAEAMISMIDGTIEGKPGKVASAAKLTERAAEDEDLGREINFLANKFLADMPKIAEPRIVPTKCPECGAPLPKKWIGKFIECEYCHFRVRLE